MTDLDKILKCRDIMLRTKVYIVKTMLFPIVKAEPSERVNEENHMPWNCGAEENC